MIRFRSYPLYVNFSSLKLNALRLEDDFQRQGDFHMMNFMRQMADGVLEIDPSNPPTRESIDYEKSVFAELRAIWHTSIGQLLMASLNKKYKTWIVPIDEEFATLCGCMAATTPGLLSAKQGGGVRVRYDPVDYDFPDFFITADAALFHELVHAYRATWSETRSLSWQRLREYKTPEEVLAVHLHNVYLACWNSQGYTRSHSNNGVLQSKDEVYKYLASDREALDAIQYYLDHEPLTTQVAQMKYPVFNPWRDQAQLEAEWAANHPKKKRSP